MRLLMDDFFGKTPKIPWRHVFALGMFCLFGACAGANNAGSVWDVEPRPDFAAVCAAKGHTVDAWGKAVCMEGERMAWEADPEQWRRDRARAPDLPGILILPPERAPFRDQVAPLSKTPF